MKKLVTVFVILLVVIGGYKLYSISYPNWTIEKKQAYAFTCLVREITKNPESLKKISVSVERGDEKIIIDSLGFSSEDLKNWSSYDFVNITLPEGSFDGNTIGVTYQKRSNKTMHFFSKVETPKRNSRIFGFGVISYSSVPYHLIMGGNNNDPEEAFDKSNLEAIKIMRKMVANM